MARARGNRHQGKRSSTVVLVLFMLLMLSVVLLMLLGLGILSLPIGSDEKSSTVGDRIKLKRLELAIKSKGEGLRKSEGEGLGKRGEQWTEVLSWEPRAFLYHNFLSKEECEYLISLAKPHMVKSSVVDSKTGKNHGEGLQVLHYEEGQKYEPHYDYFLDEFNTKNGGQRIATLLMYLSDVEEGGETVFPAAMGNFSNTPGWNEMSECAKRGLSVKPKMGDALLFWSMRPDATLDPTSLHGDIRH
ncbi:2-oxoglutarate (2OG) and Fe(II)-dependent oxygenase superfamily protein [Striga asiatica]|uniref:2-oxoglutarate (2OG) and Fe(II)-dependent oxygenase superfamily protein n=1 Tax=Striga asiatica TaxID=4170 RepID=A0A5A7Q0X0_STRAF|nr:2-oxoglutarate (2OG) and Fe(II)-dependent oxygenase superfamily protein [Striga asiatica]